MWSLPLFIFTLCAVSVYVWLKVSVLYLGLRFNEFHVYFSWDKPTCTSVDLDRPHGKTVKPPASLWVYFRGFRFLYKIKEKKKRKNTNINTNNAYSTKYIFTFAVLSELCFFKSGFFKHISTESYFTRSWTAIKTDNLQPLKASNTVKCYSKFNH